MSGFLVDSRTLVAVRDTLGRLQDQLVGMHTVIYHQEGTLGGQALESELEHFCGTWHYGVSELSGQLQDLTRRLGEAAAAYEHIEQRITHAGGGSSTTGTRGPAGSGRFAPPHTAPAKHHTAPKHHSAPKHHAASQHPAAKQHGGATAPGGPRYSGGAPLAPANGGGNHKGEHKQSGDEHPGENPHPGVGSGTTVIPPGPPGGSHYSGGPHPSGGSRHSGSGTGVTVIGGGPSHGGSSSGSGTTTIDEKIHRAEDRQRSELAAVLKTVDG